MKCPLPVYYIQHILKLLILMLCYSVYTALSSIQKSLFTTYHKSLFSYRTDFLQTLSVYNLLVSRLSFTGNIWNP